MNVARVAQLLRELADELDQPEEEHHGASTEKPVAAAPAVERTESAAVKAAPKVDDIAKARARKVLARKLGER